MVLKLDPRFPLVWRDPTGLQLGLDPARLVLRNVTTAQEKLLAALVSGVSESGFAMMAKAAGASAAEGSQFLEELRPHLQRAATASPRHRVLVCGTGPTAEQIVETLAKTGVSVSLVATTTEAAAATEAEPQQPDVALVLGHYVLAPEAHGVWLRRDIPHLPIVFSDTGVRIGPGVEPGRGPCLHCVQRHLTDADPAWPALASQLWGHRSSAETPLLAREVAARVSRMVLLRLEGGTLPGAAWRIDSASGATTLLGWPSHPECGCVVPEGNGSPGAGLSPGDPPQPSSARVASARV